MLSLKYMTEKKFVVIADLEFIFDASTITSRHEKIYTKIPHSIMWKQALTEYIIGVFVNQLFSVR